MKVWIEVDSQEDNSQILTVFMEKDKKLNNIAMLFNEINRPKYYHDLGDFLTIALTTLLMQFDIDNGIDPMEANEKLK